MVLGPNVDTYIVSRPSVARLQGLEELDLIFDLFGPNFHTYPSPSSLNVPFNPPRQSTALRYAETGPHTRTHLLPTCTVYVSSNVFQNVIAIHNDCAQPLQTRVAPGITAPLNILFDLNAKWEQYNSELSTCTA